MSIPTEYMENVAAVLTRCGFRDCQRISETLQGMVYAIVCISDHSAFRIIVDKGSIWSASRHQVSQSKAERVVFKIANKFLYKSQLGVINNRTYPVHENFSMETRILKYLTKTTECPRSIIKFKHFFSIGVSLKKMLINL